MHPYLSIVLVIGAYFLGRRGSQGTQKPAAPKALPPPPVPKPLPLPSVEGDPWGGVDYNVDFFPAEDTVTVPPPEERGISTNSDCSTIAVGLGWWSSAMDYAAKSGADSGSKAYNTILNAYLPECVDAGTVGALSFRTELKERVAAVFGAVAEQAKFTMNPRRNGHARMLPRLPRRQLLPASR